MNLKDLKWKYIKDLVASSAEVADFNQQNAPSLTFAYGGC